MKRMAALVCLAVVVACHSSDVEPTVAPPTVGCIAVGPRVSPSVATIQVGTTLHLTVTPAPCSSGGTDFHWFTSDTTVATIDSISGLVRGQKNGVVTVTVFERADPSVKAAMVLFVSP